MPDQPPPDFPDPAAPAPQPRRRFLAWLSMVGAAITAMLVGVPVLRAFVAPALPKPPTDNWVKVADDIALIDIETPVRVTFVETKQDAWIESRTLNSVWLYTADGAEFKAYNAHCTHLGCGYLFDAEAGIFFCPCHRGTFDVKNGAVLGGPPPRPLDELEVQVRESAVYVRYRNFRLGISERIES